jgi:hypothetical protein
LADGEILLRRSLLCLLGWAEVGSLALPSSGLNRGGFAPREIRSEDIARRGV